MLRCPALCLILTTAHAQQPAATSTGTAAEAPLPDIRQLILDVERNEKASEALQRDYTYHVHTEEQDFDSSGRTKKTTVTDAESLTIEGVRVNRVTSRNGRPLTPDEAKKESERIDKAVAKGKARREKNEAKGRDTNDRGDELISASRILELGTFSNPRRIMLDGRSTIVVDYTGDPNAKTRSSAEGVIRDLVGTAWIDEQDRALIRGEGHFVNDYKIAAGLVADIHKGTSFSFRATKINNEVWLPARIEGQGTARILLFVKVNGHLTVITSDYRKFRTTTTIIPSNRIIGPDGQPISEPQPPPTSAPPPP